MYNLVSNSLVTFLVQLIFAPDDTRMLLVRSPKEAKGAEFHSLDFIGIAAQFNRRAEWHNVTTDDGYVLSVFRVPPNPATSHQSGKSPVVFVQHGLIASADPFIIFGPDRSLPFLLSDAGYDVWLGNTRGNTYNRKHQTLSPDDTRFWNFSIDEFGLMDLPAMLDYVLRVTGQLTLTYIGHSQGCTMLLMLLSERMEYNDKVNLAVFMTPAAYFKTQNPMRSFLLATGQLLMSHEDTGAIEILARSTAFPTLFKSCRNNVVTLEVCYFVFHQILGPDRLHSGVETWAKLFEYFPSGTSVKNFYHFAQLFKSGDLQHYDHGSREANIQRYNQPVPPKYDVSKVKVPTVIFRAENDPLVTGDDVEELIRHLSPNVVKTSQLIREINHFSITYAEGIKELFFDDLMKIIAKFHEHDFDYDLVGETMNITVSTSV